VKLPVAGSLLPPDLVLTGPVNCPFPYEALSVGYVQEESWEGGYGVPSPGSTKVGTRMKQHANYRTLGWCRLLI